MTENVMFHYPKWEDGSKTGHTICIITCQNKTFIGSALCSTHDNFEFKVGRQLAYERASEAIALFIRKKQDKINIMQEEVNKFEEALDNEQ